MSIALALGITPFTCTDDTHKTWAVARGLSASQPLTAVSTSIIFIDNFESAALFLYFISCFSIIIVCCEASRFHVAVKFYSSSMYADPISKKEHLKSFPRSMLSSLAQSRQYYMSGKWTRRPLIIAFITLLLLYLLTRIPISATLSSRLRRPERVQTNPIYNSTLGVSLFFHFFLVLIELLRVYS